MGALHVSSACVMIFVTLLYIIALGSTYWYASETYLTGANDNGTVYFESKYTINEGLFQSKIKSQVTCTAEGLSWFKNSFNTSNVECAGTKTRTSSLDHYKDICATNPNGPKSDKYTSRQKDFCRSNNAVISMMVLAVITSFIAGASAFVPAAKPAALCMITFAWIFGMIAMAVYAANHSAVFGTTLDVFDILTVDGVSFQLFSGTDLSNNFLGVSNKVYSSEGTQHNLNYDFSVNEKVGGGVITDKSRRFHFSFAFCIIGWTLSFITFFLLLAAPQESKVVAPATQMG